MTIATDMIEKAIESNNGKLNQDELHELLKQSDNERGYEPEQDWGEQTTTWTFEDDSAIRFSNSEIHAYGEMPKTNDIDWYLVSN